MPALTADQRAFASWDGHVIVCGLHDEGLRVVEQLHLAGVAVLVVDDVPDPRLVRSLDRLEIAHLAADSRLPDTLEAAGIAGALAVICVESDDLHTMATALLARELAEARVIVQLRNPAVGRALKDVGVEVFDVARLAAPSIVDSCTGSEVRSLDLGGEEFLVVASTTTSAGSLRDLYGDLAPIAVASGPIVVTAPGRDHEVQVGDVVTVVGTPEAIRSAGLGVQVRRPVEPVFVGARAPRIQKDAKDRRAALVATIARSLDRRLKLALVALFVLVTVSVTVLMIGYREPSGRKMSVVDALYFTVETVGTVGYGDFYFRNQPEWLRIFAICLMLVGATLATLFFALLTNMLIGRQIAESLGLRRITGMSEHVIVIGAGAVGIAVLDELRAQDTSVVVIEADENSRFLAQLRAHDVPVVVADATLPETLNAAKIGRAKAVAVMTSSDLVNIETGLAVRDLLGDRWSEVPVVLRIFDRRLARTVGTGFDFRHVRSPAALAAPWFVGAALGLDVLSTFYVGDQPLLVARLGVTLGGHLEGLSMADLPAQVRVVSLVRADGLVEHPPRRATRLVAGDSAYLIGPYDELLRLLRADALV
ncbi:MAG: Calcium-gated potassium channel mthK [Marmoricola sp.]|nr:Calcium-gated potassium channel mthK [Marmoricola sp.]